MRNSFIDTLCEIAEADERLFLLCGDLGYNVLEKFADKFPQRFVNVGIAEQNMMQVASGLALDGYTVFTYSIGNFATLRCMEQIRYDICYHNLNVKVIAVGAGYAYGPLGASHHTTEDLAMLRSIPNMVVATPGDPLEVKAITRALARHPGPGYIRLNKAGERTVHTSLPNICSIGASFSINSGRHVAILAAGAMLIPANDYIQRQILPWSLLSFPFVSHLDKQALKSIVETHSFVITVEEHQLNGGFGSAVVEALSDMYAAGEIPRMPRVKRIGIPNQFLAICGTQEFLREVAGITFEGADKYVVVSP